MPSDFRRAFALIEANARHADIGDAISFLMRVLYEKSNFAGIVGLVDRYLPRPQEAGDTPQLAIALSRWWGNYRAWT
jgi:hypothetical protein